MIIGDSFVFLHPPKTGGSFVTEALTEIYADRFGRPIVNVDKHGWTDRIPVEHHSKQMVTTVRNPFDYYVSHYMFGYWINREVEQWLIWWDDKEMKKRFPKYPYLTFPEFIEAVLEVGYNHPLPTLANSLRLGPMTVMMLRYLTPSYVELMGDLVASGDTDPLKRSIARTKVLHTESLNQDTYDWLLQLGVPPAVAEPVLSKPKIQPVNTPDGVHLERGHGQPRQVHWSELFDARTTAAVMEREWLFFELFPEYTSNSLQAS